jgi:P-type Cu2+ transporter
MSHDHQNHHAMMAQDFKKRFFISLVLSIPVLILSPTIQGWFNFSVPSFTGDSYLLFTLASIIALYTGWPFYTHGLAELKRKQLGMMVLVSLAVLSGYLYSVATTFFIPGEDFYWEVSTLVMILLLGHWLEMRAVVVTSGALNELIKLIPPMANILNKDGTTTEVETEKLAVGDLILIRPGEKVPIDGLIVEGQSSLNESLITGESKPVSKIKDDVVIGGALNIDGALTVRVNKTGKDTALSQIIELVRIAQESQPKTQKLADRAAHYLTIIAIVVGILTFITWNFFLGATFVFALTLTITVIVITCPHALGLAIPTVSTITGTLAAKNGILIKDMTGLEKAKNVTWIMFDKTGTLTKGDFGVSDIVSFGSVKEKQLLQIAGSLEVRSEHVIGKSIAKEAQSQSSIVLEVKNFKAIPGKGVSGTVEINDKQSEVIIGTKSLLQQEGVTFSQEQVVSINNLEGQGKTVILVSTQDSLLGVIALSDVIKKESKQAIERLKKLGIKVAMLTGDNKQTAKYVAEELGLDTFFAEVLPEDKVEAVKKLQNSKDGNEVVMMVGDGINDAPALTQADIGVAIGAGTDVAIESAEIVLVKNNPIDIVKLITLSRQTMRKMKQNLAWATGYNVLAIPAAAGVFVSWGLILRPEWGAIAMTLSSVIVVINALLLKRTDLTLVD